MHTKDIKDVTDDMIVDAVASFGFRGAPEVSMVAERLGLLSSPQNPAVDRKKTKPLARRLYGLTVGAKRLEIDLSGSYVLVPSEWARRLVGLDMIQLTAAIRGQE